MLSRRASAKRQRRLCGVRGAHAAAREARVLPGLIMSLDLDPSLFAGASLHRFENSLIA
jgi:hypothetical protein